MYAFDGCTSLTSIDIPNGVPSIGESTFMDCHSMTSVVIPESVTSIGLRAFYRCYNLTSITFEGTVEQWNAITTDFEWNVFPATEVICSDGVVSLG